MLFIKIIFILKSDLYDDFQTIRGRDPRMSEPTRPMRSASPGSREYVSTPTHSTTLCDLKYSVCDFVHLLFLVDVLNSSIYY